MSDVPHWHLELTCIEADVPLRTVRYYGEYWGYQVEAIDVETEDGFVLRMHHLISKKHKRREFDS